MAGRRDHDHARAIVEIIERERRLMARREADRLRALETQTLRDEIEWLRAALERAHEMLDREQGHSAETWQDRERLRTTVQP